MTDRTTVMLVENDIVIRHPLAEYLRECGFEVVEAANGEEAMLALKAKTLKIEIVLAAMSAPGSGFALRQWVREQQLPVEIILAGSVEKAVEEAGDLCNEGPGLSRPYEHRLVLDQIRQALARRNNGKA